MIFKKREGLKILSRTELLIDSSAVECGIEKRRKKKMNWKNLIIACSIFFILGIMIPSKAEAILPPIPKRFHKEGLVEAYETACYRGRWGVICIRPRPAKGPLVKVKWWNNRGQSGTAWLLYSGQGGGGKVGRIGKKHKPILARFKHGSGVLGEVVVYAAKTWHRIR